MTRSGCVSAYASAEGAPPRTAEHVPSLDPEVRSKLLDVVDQVPRRVVDERRVRGALAASALVEDDDPVRVRVEEAAMVRFRPEARASVKEDHRPPVCVAALFEIELVHVGHTEAPRAVGLDGRVVAAARRRLDRAGHEGAFFASRASRRARRPSPDFSSSFRELASRLSENRPLVALASAVFTRSRVISMNLACARKGVCPGLSWTRSYFPSGMRIQLFTLSAHWMLRMLDQARAEHGVLDRDHHLDATMEVARHPVGARDVDLVLAAVREVEDAPVLEEAVDDRAHLDGLAHAAGRPGAGSRCRGRASVIGTPACDAR